MNDVEVKARLQDRSTAVRRPVDANPGRRSVPALPPRRLLGVRDDEGARDALPCSLKGNIRKSSKLSSACTVRRRASAYLLLRDHRARPVAAVHHLGIGRFLSVGGPVDRSDGIDELARLRLVVETATVAAREPGSEALPAGGDGEGRSGEEDLAEESGGEHGCTRGRRGRGKVDLSGL